MNARMMVIPLVALLLAAGAPKDGMVQQELKKLQGTWKVIRFEAGGRDQTAKGPKQIVIKGDELHGLAPNVKFRIDPAKKPKTLDLIDQGDAKRIFPLLYELNDDKLKIVILIVTAGMGQAHTRPERY